MISEEMLGYVVMFGVCGLLSYKAIKLWWPTFMQRKNLSVPALIDHAINAPAKERMRQMTMFGTKRETLKINAINILLSVAWLSSGMLSNDLFLGVMVYLCMGYVVTKVKGMPTPVDTTKLDFMDRVTIRMYYAWQWPVLLMR
jgi:hypothetical protein